MPKPDIDPATFKRITGRSAPGPHEIAPGHLVLTGPSLHSGLNAPPPASQAFVLGGAHSYVDIHFIAMTYAGVGDKDQVFRWLEKGYEERSNQMVWLAVDPLWYQLHSDPLYKDLLRRIGLPQYSR